MTPLNTEGLFRGLALVGKPNTPEARGVFSNLVSGQYFEAMGIPVLRGRVFTDEDGALSRRVAILNQTTARYVFGDADPIGRAIAWGSAPDDPLEVIGVVEDTRQNSLRDDAPRMVYTPFAVRPSQVAIRTTGAAMALAPVVRDLARQVSHDLVVARVRTMHDQVDSSLVRERALMLLSSAFAIVASILACIGLYGVMSFHVARRTREIGIRLALGEARRSVFTGILRYTTRLSVVGIIVGVGGAVLVTRLVSAFLYGLSPRDPLTLPAVSIGLVATALVAGWLPARRAARVDPLAAIRSE
jgi:predicted permease